MAANGRRSPRHPLLSARHATVAVPIQESRLQAGLGGPEPETAQEGLWEPVLAVTHVVRDPSPSRQATSRALRDYHVATA